MLRKAFEGEFAASKDAEEIELLQFWLDACYFFPLHNFVTRVFAHLILSHTVKQNR